MFSNCEGIKKQMKRKRIKRRERNQKKSKEEKKKEVERERLPGHGMNTVQMYVRVSYDLCIIRRMIVEDAPAPLRKRKKRRSTSVVVVVVVIALLWLLRKSKVDLEGSCRRNFQFQCKNSSPRTTEFVYLFGFCERSEIGICPASVCWWSFVGLLFQREYAMRCGTAHGEKL